MTRPTDDAIKARALRYSSKDPGSCDDASTRLKGDSFWRETGATQCERIAVSYMERGTPGNHWAVAVRWAGDQEDTIVDPTIRQFGSVKRVFVGTTQAWLSKLQKHIKNGSKFTLDPGGREYANSKYKFFSPSFDPDSVSLAFTPQALLGKLPSSEDDFLADTLTKVTPKG